MKNIREVEIEIGELSERLSEAEGAYEREEDEKRAEILWRKIRRIEKRIEKLVEMQDELEDEEESEKEEEEEEGVETDVCLTCGGDLVYMGVDKDTGNNLYKCNKCHGLYEEEGGE